MGLLNEVIGAVVAEEALDKLDPNANLIEKGIAAVVGFEGEGTLENVIDGFMHKKEPEADASDSDQSA